MTERPYPATTGQQVERGWRYGWIDALRRNRLGGLILGDTFAWGDIAAYLVGIALGVAAEVLHRGTGSLACPDEGPSVTDLQPQVEAIDHQVLLMERGSRPSQSSGDATNIKERNKSVGAWNRAQRQSRCSYVASQRGKKSRGAPPYRPKAKCRHCATDTVASTCSSVKRP